MHAGPRLLTRRTTLALGAAAIAVAGCDDGDNPEPTPPPAPDPDVALVDDVLAELVDAEAMASAAGLLELAAMHRAHVEALDGELPTQELTRIRTEAAVRRAEVRLQRILVHAAASAESGALARLFAAMSAAVSQRLSRSLA